MTSHPSAEILALYGSSDLPLFERWKIRRHISACDVCDRQHTIFRASTAELKRLAATETLTGFEAIADWASLEHEIAGNIVVGLDASRCIEKKRVSRSIFIKLAAASAMLLLFVLGWVTHIPMEQSTRLYGAISGAFGHKHAHDYQGPVLRSLPDGIVVGSPDTSLTILHPASAVVSVSGTSGVEARYVDEETGQVTITDVYGH